MRIQGTIAAILLLQCSLRAAEGTASLSGKVTDPAGLGTANTQVELQSEKVTNDQYRTTTESGGVYRISGLPAGDYTLTFQERGFLRLRLKSIQVVEGEQKVLPTMELDVGGSCGTVGFLDYARFLPPGDRTSALRGSIKIQQKSRNDGPAVSDADVTLGVRPDDATYRTKTDAKGQFEFRGLTPGYYYLEVTHANFYPLRDGVHMIREGLDSTLEPVYIEHCSGSCKPKPLSRHALENLCY